MNIRPAAGIAHTGDAGIQSAAHALNAFEEAHGEGLREALLEGGADLILIETVFDTLNAKAAVFAVEQVFAAAGSRPRTVSHDFPAGFRPCSLHSALPYLSSQ